MYVCVYVYFCSVKPSTATATAHKQTKPSNANTVHKHTLSKYTHTNTIPVAVTDSTPVMKKPAGLLAKFAELSKKFNRSV